jgi:hypothetical protein
MSSSNLDPQFGQNRDLATNSLEALSSKSEKLSGYFDGFFSIDNDFKSNSFQAENGSVELLSNISISSGENHQPGENARNYRFQSSSNRMNYILSQFQEVSNLAVDAGGDLRGDFVGLFNKKIADDYNKMADNGKWNLHHYTYDAKKDDDFFNRGETKLGDFFNQVNTNTFTYAKDGVDDLNVKYTPPKNLNSARDMAKLIHDGDSLFNRSAGEAKIQEYYQLGDSNIRVFETDEAGRVKLNSEEQSAAADDELFQKVKLITGFAREDDYGNVIDNSPTEIQKFFDEYIQKHEDFYTADADARKAMRNSSDPEIRAKVPKFQILEMEGGNIDTESIGDNGLAPGELAARLKANGDSPDAMLKTYLQNYMFNFVVKKVEKKDLATKSIELNQKIAYDEFFEVEKTYDPTVQGSFRETKTFNFDSFMEDVNKTEGQPLYARGQSELGKLSDIFIENFDINNSRYFEDNRTLFDLLSGDLGTGGGATDNENINNLLFGSLRQSNHQLADEVLDVMGSEGYDEISTDLFTKDLRGKLLLINFQLNDDDFLNKAEGQVIDARDVSAYMKKVIFKDILDGVVDIDDATFEEITSDSKKMDKYISENKVAIKINPFLMKEAGIEPTYQDRLRFDRYNKAMTFVDDMERRGKSFESYRKPANNDTNTMTEEQVTAFRERKGDASLVEDFINNHQNTRDLEDEFKIDYLLNSYDELEVGMANPHNVVMAGQMMTASSKNSRYFTKERSKPKSDGSVTASRNLPPPMLTETVTSSVIAKIGQTMIDKVNQSKEKNPFAQITLDANGNYVLDGEYDEETTQIFDKLISGFNDLRRINPSISDFSKEVTRTNDMMQEAASEVIDDILGNFTTEFKIGQNGVPKTLSQDEHGWTNEDVNNGMFIRDVKTSWGKNAKVLTKFWTADYTDPVTGETTKEKVYQDEDGNTIKYSGGGNIKMLDLYKALEHERKYMNRHDYAERRQNYVQMMYTMNQMFTKASNSQVTVKNNKFGEGERFTGTLAEHIANIPNQKRIAEQLDKIEIGNIDVGNVIKDITDTLNDLNKKMSGQVSMRPINDAKTTSSDDVRMLDKLSKGRDGTASGYADGLRDYVDDYMLDNDKVYDVSFKNANRDIQASKSIIDIVGESPKLAGGNLDQIKTVKEYLQKVIDYHENISENKDDASLADKAIIEAWLEDKADVSIARQTIGSMSGISSIKADIDIIDHVLDPRVSGNSEGAVNDYLKELHDTQKDKNRLSRGLSTYRADLHKLRLAARKGVDGENSEFMKILYGDPEVENDQGIDFSVIEDAFTGKNLNYNMDPKYGDFKEGLEEQIETIRNSNNAVKKEQLTKDLIYYIDSAAGGIKSASKELTQVNQTMDADFLEEGDENISLTSIIEKNKVRVEDKSVQELLILTMIMEMFERSTWEFNQWLNDETRYS